MIAATLLMLAQATATPVPAPMAAPVSPERGDARCLAAFGLLANDPKPDVQRASQMGALFFYGKLLGRNPRIDLRAAMTEAAAIAGPQVKAELQRCGGELQRSGEAMQAVGAALAGTAPRATPTPRPTPSPTATRRR
ncbi:MAG: hypothetical protein JWN21_2168 [Sphingomonas bacterium]|uniref:hypothetical protein n=1 Tax=Sphingomonas bacterium TaxID=1895847 RepID=UPI002613DAB4|nr:hypothetical protein [Sphingomonas bacterium]MDB5696625.1 hypothetical protein [Sphingomonas bacterium]